MELIKSNITKVAIIVFMTLNLLLNMSAPSLGDDNIRGLLSTWVQHDEIEQETLLEFNEYKLVKSNIEPVLAIKTSTNIYPLLFQVREGGLSYLIYKVFLSVFSSKVTLILIHFLVSSLTFFLMLRSLQLIVPRLYPTLALVLSISPITLYNYGPYIADKFLHLLMWGVIYQFLNKAPQKKTLFLIGAGFLIKITFLWNYLFAIALTQTDWKKKGSFIQSHKKLLTILSLGFLVIIFLLREQFHFELLKEHIFIKNTDFYIRFITSLSTQVISPALYLQYFTMSKSSFLLASLEILTLMTVFLSTIICIIKKRDLTGLRGITIALCVYFSTMLLAIYQGSNFSDFTFDIYPFVLVIILTITSKSSLKLFRCYVSLIIAISGVWYIDYLRYGPADEISFNFHSEVYQQITNKNLDSVIVTSKYDLGLVDFISNQKVKSTFFEMNPSRAKLFKGTCSINYIYQNWGHELPISRSQITKQINESLALKNKENVILGKYQSPKAQFICVK